MAVPSTLVEIVRRVTRPRSTQAYASGAFTLGDKALPFFWLGALLQAGAARHRGRPHAPVVVIRSAAQRVALHVDEVLGNQEVVVKNLGPAAVARARPGRHDAAALGRAGADLQPGGAGHAVRRSGARSTVRRAARRRPSPSVPAAGGRSTRRRWCWWWTIRSPCAASRSACWQREGYRVALAKDGLDALDKLAEERPPWCCRDIEMPRMDGFDLVRNMRADARLADLPVIMITSRIAQKHRDYAAELGVDHYLGKPYSEDELLSLVARYVQEAAAH